MLLKMAMDGQLEAPMILIEDKVERRGFPLLLQFIQRLVPSSGRTDVFCFKLNTYELKDELFTGDNRLFVHPVYKELLMRPNVSLDYKFDVFDYFTKFCDSTGSYSSRSVVVDSISSLLVNNELNMTARTLDKFVDTYSERMKFQLVGLFHSDCHKARDVKAIEYMFPVIIKVAASDFDYFSEATVIYKEPTGIASKEVEYYKISDDDIMEIKKEKSLRTQPESSSTIVDEQSLSSKLTFNLSLNETEKEARAKVVLPYERLHQDKSGGGCINYELERNDDFDEDDPDDDLNF